MGQFSVSLVETSDSTHPYEVVIRDGDSIMHTRRVATEAEARDLLLKVTSADGYDDSGEVPKIQIDVTKNK